MLDAWSPSNRESNIPRLQYNDTDASSSSDRFLINGSYLNLQSINIGYTLPKSLTRRLGLTKVRVYGAADNVYCGASERDSILAQVSPAHLATSSMRLFVPSLVVLHFNFKLLDNEILYR